jgi:hypothetical protein
MNWTHPKRPHFAGPFLKRLKGFEPSTFCMASRSWDWVHALNVPAKWRTSAARGGAAECLGYHEKSREFPD